MSFPLLQEYIEKLDDEREVTLFLLAFLFKVMQTKSVKAWIRLADRFFATYSDELYRYGGDDANRDYRGLLVCPSGQLHIPGFRHREHGNHSFEQAEGAKSGG